jgi:hypothetical protein
LDSQHEAFIPENKIFPIRYAKPVFFIGGPSILRLMSRKECWACSKYVSTVLQKEKGDSGAEAVQIKAGLMKEDAIWMRDARFC